MIFTAYRLSLKRYAKAGAFTGEGARRAGGRWNSPGNPVVYTSGTLSLAALEYLVHFDSLRDIPELVYFKIEFDQRMVENLKSLPEDWRHIPPTSGSQAAGDTWLMEKASAMLQIPSTVVPTESNFLINPNHPDFKGIQIHPPVPFETDLRLFS